MITIKNIQRKEPGFYLGVLSDGRKFKIFKDNTIESYTKTGKEDKGKAVSKKANDWGFWFEGIKEICFGNTSKKQAQNIMLDYLNKEI